MVPLDSTISTPGVSRTSLEEHWAPDCDSTRRFYPALEHGVTHVEANFSSTLKLLSEIDASRSGAHTDRLRIGAKTIYDTYYCPECVAARVGKALVISPFSRAS